MKKINQILFKTFTLLLIILVPFSYNGILVFKHICNSTNTISVYFFVNDKCSDEPKDHCCDDNSNHYRMQSCCNDTESECEAENNHAESIKFSDNKTCCLDETQNISINADILNKDKFSQIPYHPITYLTHIENYLPGSKNHYLSTSENLSFNSQTLKIISFILNNSQDKSSDSNLS